MKVPKILPYIWQNNPTNLYIGMKEAQRIMKAHAKPVTPAVIIEIKKCLIS